MLSFNVCAGRKNKLQMSNRTRNRENRANVNKNLQLFTNERSPCIRWTHVAPAWTQLKRLLWKADGGKQPHPAQGATTFRSEPGTRDVGDG